MKLVSATVVSIIRGMELLAYTLIYRHSFVAFTQPSRDGMMDQMKDVFWQFVVLGFGCLLAIFVAVCIFILINFIASRSDSTCWKVEGCIRLEKEGRGRGGEEKRKRRGRREE